MTDIKPYRFLFERIKTRLLATAAFTALHVDAFATNGVDQSSIAPASPATAQAAASTNCQAAIDLVFVVDTSGSLDLCACDAFTKMQTFLKNAVASFNVNPGGAHVGLVDFSSDAQLLLGLSDDVVAVNRAIDTMPNFRGQTATQKGLGLAQAELDAHGRNGVAHVIILLTDGNPDSQDLAVAAATAIKNDPLGIEIFGIAVNRSGDIDLNKFGQIVSAPASTHVFALNNFDGFSNILQQLVVNVCPPAGTDMSVVKNDAPDPVNVGSNLTYTVTVRNNGPGAATGVVLTDTLPAGVNWVSSGASQSNCSFANGVLTCNLGDLANGASATITVVVVPTAAGQICNLAEVNANETDPSPANNTITECTTVNAPPKSADLSVTKTDSPDPVIAGSNLAYLVTVTNRGPNAATGVIVTDTLPANVAFVSALSSQGNCSQANGIVTCDLGNLASGAAAVITVTVKPTAAGQICNRASVLGNETDPNPNNNSATECTTVNAPAAADLAVTKTDSFDPVMVGDTLTYTVTVTNQGPNSAAGVLLTDTLPAGVNFISANATQGNCAFANGIVSCSLGQMAPGAVITVTIAATPTVAGQLCDTASVRANEADPNTANNVATECTTVTAPSVEADLSLTKIASPNPATIGGALTYQMIVRNLGPASATGVMFNDPLPAGVELVSATASQGSLFATVAGDTTITGGLGNLAGGATATVTIVVKPIGAGPATNCQAALDVMFVVDSSGSIALCGCNAFEKMKAFCKNVVAAFNVSPNGVHVGLVDFSSRQDTRLVLPLSGDAPAVNTAIDTLPYFGNSTDIAGGLTVAQAEIAAHGRTGVPHVIILLTDGVADSGTSLENAAAASKAAGTEIFSIGVTSDIDVAQLQRIASAPTETHVFAVSDFDGLNNILRQLVVDLCPPPVEFTVCNTATVAANEPDPNVDNNTATACVRVVFEERPRLAIARAGSNAIISWPASATGFVLEATQSLSPVIQWTVVPGDPVVVGDRNTVTVDASGAMKFYRLRKP